MKRFIATLVASCVAVPTVSAQQPAAKPAEAAVAARNRAVLDDLPFADRDDFAAATRGFIATTPNESVLDFLSLCWGVLPLKIPPSESLDEMIRHSIDAARRAGIVEPGQEVVITGGMPLNVPGKTNFIKVEQIL